MNKRSAPLGKLETSIRKNTILSLMITGIGYLYPLMVFVYAARILRPDGLGRTSFAASVAVYFTMITRLGMSIYGMRAVTDQKKSDSGLTLVTAELFLLRFFSGLFSCLLFFLAVCFVPEFQKDRIMMMIYGFSILGAIPECEWLFKGLEDYISLMLSTTAARFIGITALFLLVRKESDIYTYACISVAVPFLTYLIQIYFSEKKWHMHVISRCAELVFSRKVWDSFRKHLKPLLFFFLMNCAGTIYFHIDTVILGFLKGKTVVGLYSCASKIKLLLPTLTGALWAAAFPQSTILWKSKRLNEFKTLSEKSFHVVMAVMVPATVYFILFADTWIRIIGGADYLDAIPMMRLLLLAVIPIGFSNILGGQMLIPMGLEKFLFLSQGLGAISNVLMNITLIPSFSAAGAAIANVFSEILVTLAAYFFVRRTVAIKMIDQRVMIKCFAGCLVSGFFSRAITGLIPISPVLNGLFSACLFSLVYLVIMLLFRDPFFLEIRSVLKKYYQQYFPEQGRKWISRFRRGCRKVLYDIRAEIMPQKAVLFCPCCETKLLTFVPGNFLGRPEIFNPERYMHMRQDVLCPVCGSLPRHRILASWCENNISLLRSAEILYFAPEVSMMTWFKRNRISCVTADLFYKADLQLDIQNTHLPDHSFDMIICNHVLEHVSDFRAALSEVYRVLRPCGYFICSFPIDMNIDELIEGPDDLPAEENIRRFGQFDHKRVFGRNADRFLRDAGFSVERINGETFGEEILPITAPADYDVNFLFLCKKPASGKQDAD